MTLKDLILQSEVVKSGERFTASQLAKHLGKDKGAVQFELRQMTEEEMFIAEHGSRADPVKYRRRNLKTQWIHRARLCDPKGLRAARESLTRTVGGA
jgi:hypothetical protein